MNRWFSGRARYAARLVGALAVVLGLASQSALVATMPATVVARAQLSALDGAAICHAGDADAGSVPHAPAHHPADCALCPLCAALGAPAPILAAAPAVPTPRGVARAARPAWRQARAPPSPAQTAPYPRGPPALA